MDCIDRRMGLRFLLASLCTLQCTVHSMYTCCSLQCTAMHDLQNYATSADVLSADVWLPLLCVFTKLRNFHPVGVFVLTTRFESFPVSYRYCVLHSLTFIVIVLHLLSFIKLFPAQRTPFSGDNTVHWNTRQDRSLTEGNGIEDERCCRGVEVVTEWNSNENCYGFSFECGMATKPSGQSSVTAVLRRAVECKL